jgi:hypothetical protein
MDILPTIPIRAQIKLFKEEMIMMGNQMWLKPLGVKTFVIGVAIIGGLVVGTFSISPAIAKAFSNPIQSLSSAPVFPRNQSGQTYGSDMYSTSPATEPDLVLARGTDGTIGYVKSIDLYGTQPKTPEEAVALNPKVGDVKQIPLYAVDGKTVIGKYNIVAGKVGGITAEENQNSASTK